MLAGEKPVFGPPASQCDTLIQGKFRRFITGSPERGPVSDRKELDFLALVHGSGLLGVLRVSRSKTECNGLEATRGPYNGKGGASTSCASGHSFGSVPGIVSRGLRVRGGLRQGRQEAQFTGLLGVLGIFHEGEHDRGGVVEAISHLGGETSETGLDGDERILHGHEIHAGDVEVLTAAGGVVGQMTGALESLDDDVDVGVLGEVLLCLGFAREKGDLFDAR